MAIELRCEGNLYGVYDPEAHTLEVRCKRRAHGAYPGTIVLHTISLETGKVVDTHKYKDPRVDQQKGLGDASR
jgi:hypothetical protein